MQLHQLVLNAVNDDVTASALTKWQPVPDASPQADESAQLNTSPVGPMLCSWFRRSSSCRGASAIASSEELPSAVSAAVERRAHRICRLPAENREPPVVVRYEPGQACECSNGLPVVLGLLS